MVAAALVLALVAGAGGCGFKLRSYSFAGNVESFSVTGETRSLVAVPLRRALRQAGLEEVADGGGALQVQLLDQDTERRSVSTTGQTRAGEYELEYRVRYRLVSGDGEELLPATWIERRRAYRVDAGNIVGSSEEQAILSRELVQDLVAQILRSMDAVTRSAAAVAG